MVNTTVAYEMAVLRGRSHCSCQYGPPLSGGITHAQQTVQTGVVCYTTSVDIRYSREGMRTGQGLAGDGEAVGRVSSSCSWRSCCQHKQQKRFLKMHTSVRTGLHLDQ